MRPRKSTRSLCQLLGKSTQGYYDNRKRTSEADGQEIMALNLVLEKRKVHKKAGTIELYHMLKEDFKAHNIKIGRDKLHRLLKEHNLILKIKGRKPKTTDPTGADKHFPNQIRELLLTAAKKAVYLYNYEKPHSSCGYMTPIMAHDYKGPLINKWKTKSVEKNQQKKRLGYAKRVIKKLLNKKSVTEEYLMDLISKLSKRYQLNQENLEVEVFKTVNNNTC